MKYLYAAADFSTMDSAPLQTKTKSMFTIMTAFCNVLLHVTDFYELNGIVSGWLILFWVTVCPSPYVIMSIITVELTSPNSLI